MRKILLFFSLFLAFILFYSCSESTNQTLEENNISGVLVDEQDVPIPFATVYVVRVSEGKTNVLVKEEVVAVDTTDEDGNFSFKSLPTPLGNLKIRVVHQDFKVFEDFLLALLEKQPKNKLRFRILHNNDCCGKIIIRTLGPDSTTLGGVEVRLNRGRDLVRKTKSNDNGIVVFENVCAGGYWVRISKEGYQVIEREFNLGNCDTLTLTFVLSRREVDTCCRGVIGVEVKNQNGEVLNGSVVKLRKNGILLTTQTVRENQPVYFRELCPGTYSLLILKEGYKTVERNVSIECNDSIFVSVQMEIDTCCNSVLRVIIKNTEGQRLPQAKVSIWKSGVRLGYYYTNDEGVVVFRELCKGKYGFDVEKEGFKRIEFSVEIGCGEEKEITKVLEAVQQDTCCNGSIKVYVKNSEERPINQAIVAIWKNDKKLGYYSTNDSGYVIFRELCAGRYVLTISKDGFKTQEFVVELGCNEVKEFTKILQRVDNDTCCKGVVIIRVKDRSNESNINEATVKMWKNGQVVKSGTTAEGKVVFREICPGEYSFSILKDTYKSIEFSLRFECNDTIEITKFLEKENVDTCCKGRIIVYVKDSSNNEPLANTEVRLWKGSQKISVKYSNESGKVVFENLCPGTYQISMSRSEYKGLEFSFELDCNQTREFTKYLSRKSDTCCTARLKLKIIDDSTGSAISGARVLVRYNQTVVADPQSNSEGWAVAQNLCAPRTYSIRVSAEGYEVREFTITFQECNTIQETIRLRRR
ncbi:MAG: carboxypeptidase regulatory-like domain-containing protein [Ignavibacteria bacterium]|nr:carboxypeptidase regulatory-like domain-containing protein [Ignavibacteria bacterium]